jgi:hypothetical protein
LLGELQFERWIGNAAEIRTKRVRKQKTDRQDAQLQRDTTPFRIVIPATLALDPYRRRAAREPRPPRLN